MRRMREKLTKKIGILAAVGILICTALTIPALASDSSGVKGNACYTHGDVNADGSITSKDAIRVLYHLNFPDDYAVEQDCDFNGDHVVNTKDAIHLLYSTNGLFSDILGYKLEGVIHAYGEPIWTWTEKDGEVSVTAKYRCACGTRESVVIGKVELTESVKATCLKEGSCTYSASATYDNVEYHTSKTMDVKALGHKLAKDACSDRKCQNTGCDYVKKSAGHQFGKAQVTKATCTTPEIHKYVCDTCGFEYEEKIGAASGHTLDLTSLQEIQTNKKTCEYKQVYTCTTCKKDVESGRVHKHSYVAAIQKEATCKSEGLKTYKCSSCGDTGKESENIPKNESAHVWGNGSTSGDITTYTCTLCAETKTTVNASQKKEATVSKETLQSVNEVEVNEATIKLDQNTIGQLSGDVQIRVDKVKDIGTLGLSKEEQKQIGDNPIYDFNLSSDKGNVSEFDGTVTVTLPYTLQEGDDAECIDVWFINDSGKVEIVKGVYSNGYVTFETKHFSYYTVTRLTPKQRCEFYGHSETTRKVNATCEEDGYTQHVCVRCAKTWKTDVTERLGHSYEEKTVAATCEKDGSKTETCKHCKDERTTVLPKTGHRWETVTETAATCTKQGEKQSVCRNDKCGQTKTEVIPKKAHVYQSTTVDPTCDTRGYDLEKCKNCGHEEKKNEKEAIGHDYEAIWSWVEDEGNITATLTLTCKRDKEHAIQKAAVVDIKKFVAPSCSDGGSTTYLAVVCYNQITYEDEYVVGEENYTHQPGEEWKYNSEQHYYICTLCGEKVDAEKHTFDEGTVTEQATCAKEGTMTYACACGYKKEESVPKKEHHFVNDVCTECGSDKNKCNHKKLHKVTVELEADGVCSGGTFTYRTCDCGEVKYAYDYGMLEWDLDVEYEQTTDENGYIQTIATGICNTCGLSFEYIHGYEMLEDCVGMRTCKLTAETKDHQLLLDFEGYDELGAEAKMYHPTIVVDEVVDMTQYGLCGGTVTTGHCPCGKCTSFSDNTWDDCNWKYIWFDDTTKASWYECSSCGIKRESSAVGDEEEGCEGHSASKCNFYKDDTKLIGFVGNSIYYSHDCDYEFVLDGTTCSDGYLVIATCEDCKHTESWYEQPEEETHWTYETDRTQIPGESGQFIWRQECPCGQESAVDCGLAMTIDSTEREETNTGWIITSTGKLWTTKTNLTFERKAVYTVKEHACTYECVVTETYWIDGEVLVEYETKGKGHLDEFTQTSYELNGDSCEDGGVAIIECTACGKTSKTTIWGHYNRFVKKTYHLEDYGMCAGTIQVSGCACGDYESISDQSTCDWKYSTYDSTGATIYTCSKCGVTKKALASKKESVGMCTVRYLNEYEYWKGNEKLFSVSNIYDGYEHNYQYECTFANEGDTCLDGYTVKQTCKECGEISTYYNNPMRHISYPIERYKLQEYGFCGGIAEVDECPCGAIGNVSTSSSYGEKSCNWTWYRHDEETNTTWMKCVTCGGMQSQQYGEEVTNGCIVSRECKFVFYNSDSQAVLTVEGFNSDERHDNEILRYTLNGDSCINGHIWQRCKKCGQESESWIGGHYYRTVKEYQLSEYGACGDTVIRYKECLCGKSETLDTGSLHSHCVISVTGNTYMDEQGVKHNVNVMKCGNCGLCLTEDRASVRDASTCTEQIASSVTLAVGNTAIDSFTYTSEQISHRYGQTATLLPGSVTCEDGVRIVSICKDCQHSYSYDTNYHNLMEVEGSRIDLKDYGSVCGGYVVQMACACGQCKELQLEDTACDFGTEYVTPWLGDDLSYQETADGYVSAYSNAYIKTCAVTTPEKCGFAIRECNYYQWDKEHCTATKYVTWQLGYDKATGTHKKEITIQCGEQTYHDYKLESKTETVGQTEVGTELKTCNVCKSTHRKSTTYDEDYNQIRYEEEFINTLNDGTNRSKIMTKEYDYYKGSSYLTLDYIMTADKNGAESWSRDEYVYDWKNFDCTRIRKHRSSLGDQYERKEECHVEERIWDTNNMTCTQPGESYNQCKACGRKSGNEIINPYDHNWYYNNSTHMYHCYRCGLKNVNGVSGQIVMEDLTGRYGDGISYVVGYWNKNNVQYTSYVSVVPTSADEKELILDNVECKELTKEKDGIQAISFNKAETVKAAKAAVEKAGYTGEYKLRFTFVPVGSDGNFDYAITFTDSSAK